MMIRDGRISKHTAWALNYIFVTLYVGKATHERKLISYIVIVIVIVTVIGIPFHRLLKLITAIPHPAPVGKSSISVADQ